MNNYNTIVNVVKAYNPELYKRGGLKKQGRENNAKVEKKTTLNYVVINVIMNLQNRKVILRDPIIKQRARRKGGNNAYMG